MAKKMVYLKHLKHIKVVKSLIGKNFCRFVTYPIFFFTSYYKRYKQVFGLPASKLSYYLYYCIGIIIKRTYIYTNTLIHVLSDILF